MNTKDKNGIPWAKLSQLKPGDKVKTDTGFNCMPPKVCVVHADEKKRLYIRCYCGNHLLEGQADDGEHLIGIYQFKASEGDSEAKSSKSL